MQDVSIASAPINIRNLFTKMSSVHSYNTRSSASENLYIKASRLETQKHAFSETYKQTEKKYYLLNNVLFNLFFFFYSLFLFTMLTIAILIK